MIGEVTKFIHTVLYTFWKCEFICRFMTIDICFIGLLAVDYTVILFFKRNQNYFKPGKDKLWID